MKKEKFIKQFQNAPMWQRIFITTILVLGAASYIHEHFIPKGVSQAPPEWESIVQTISQRYGGVPVDLFFDENQRNLEIWVINADEFKITDIFGMISNLFESPSSTQNKTEEQNLTQFEKMIDSNPTFTNLKDFSLWTLELIKSSKACKDLLKRNTKKITFGFKDYLFFIIPASANITIDLDKSMMAGCTTTHISNKKVIGTKSEFLSGEVTRNLILLDIETLPPAG